MEAATWFSVWESSISARETVRCHKITGRGKGGVGATLSRSVVCLCGGPCSRAGQALPTAPRCEAHGSQNPTRIAHQAAIPGRGLYIPQERGTALRLCPEALCGLASGPLAALRPGTVRCFAAAPSHVFPLRHYPAPSCVGAHVPGPLP